MKISTKGRYGLRGLVELAAQSANGEYVPLSRIAERQDVSDKFLEHPFSALKKAGIIRGMTGAQGGYRLVYKPEDITVGRILSVLEGDMSVANREAEAEETPYARIIREKVWDIIDAEVEKILDTTTLKSLVKTYGEKACTE